MRKLLFLLIIMLGMPVFAQSDEVTLSGVDEQKIELPKSDVQMKGSLV